VRRVTNAVKKGADEGDWAHPVPNEKHDKQSIQTGTKARATTRQQAGHQERGPYHPGSDVLAMSTF
jgi:hypothetical protein